MTSGGLPPGCLAPCRRVLSSVYRYLKLTRQAGVVEFVGVTQAFIGHEFDILTAERVAFARDEIPEGHSMATTDLGLELMHGACKVY